MLGAKQASSVRMSGKGAPQGPETAGSEDCSMGSVTLHRTFPLLIHILFTGLLFAIIPGYIFMSKD